MEEAKYEFGMVGLGTMGRNLVANMADHNFSVAGYDRDLKQMDALMAENAGKPVFGATSLKKLVNALKKPRIILLLVPAGKPVDAVIDELNPLLARQDIIIDLGNSHFTDTDRRIEVLAKDHLHFMGAGVSGGEMGARYGPSIMPGGAPEIYKLVGPMFEAISAKVYAQPCVKYLGVGSAGHYVKMVHNGIEYGIMQVIAEAYHLLKELGGLSNTELHQLFSIWNQGRLKSFLIEIAAEVFAQKDELTGKDLVDMILDKAQQKGTGKWTSQDALDLGAPIPSIDAAVTARVLSSYKEERVEASKKLRGPAADPDFSKDDAVASVERAVFFSMVVIYAQGLFLLRQASTERNYGLNPADITAIWKGGCIIRADMLNDFTDIFTHNPNLENLMLHEKISAQLADAQLGARHILSAAISNGIPVPAMMASLAYYDSMRSAWLPANLIQAQRDFFGAHTYQRIDREGVFHTHWVQNK